MSELPPIAKPYAVLAEEAKSAVERFNTEHAGEGFAAAWDEATSSMMVTDTKVGIGSAATLSAIEKHGAEHCLAENYRMLKAYREQSP